MDGKDIEAIIRAITEAKRLVKESAGLSETAAWLLESGKYVKQGFITDERLYNFLKSEGTDEVFLRNMDFGIDKSLYRLLLLHYYFSGAAVVPKTLAELREAVRQNDMLKQHFSKRHESGLFIIYLQQEEKAYWIDFARSFDGNHSDIETLNDSLTLCRTDLRTLLDLISRIKEKLPDRASYRLLGESILLNLKSDPALRQEVFSSVDEFFLRPEWREMLPYFYRGAIDNITELFLQQHGRLLSNFQQYSLSERLYVLATACPEDELSLFFFYHDAAAKRDEKAISAADFLKLVLARNRTDSDTIEYVTALSKTSRDKQELIYLSDYLLNLMEDHQAANWFRSVALNIIPAPFPELTGNFDHLLTTLVEKDANFVYQLLTMRFAVNGAANFLDGPWHELPDANSGLFEAYLVEWFNSPNRFHHWALHHLTNNAPINSDKFRLSAERLNKLSKTDRFLVTCKIAGYVYDKCILRSLLFSVTENIKEDETALTEELYAIFTGYVIHNYRSTLDEVYKLVAAGKLPQPIIAFYQRIIDYFEAYFKGLDTVPVLIETRPDPVLSQHVRFYTSHQVGEQMKKAQNNGLGRFFKNVTINSHRWAIRRPGEKVHTPQELATVRSEMEFPAGEIINPVASERFRKVYQLLEKHEINID